MTIPDFVTESFWKRRRSELPPRWVVTSDIVSRFSKMYGRRWVVRACDEAAAIAKVRRRVAGEFKETSARVATPAQVERWTRLLAWKRAERAGRSASGL